MYLKNTHVKQKTMYLKKSNVSIKNMYLKKTMYLFFF